MAKVSDGGGGGCDDGDADAGGGGGGGYFWLQRPQGARQAAASRALLEVPTLRYRGAGTHDLTHSGFRHHLFRGDRFGVVLDAEHEGARALLQAVRSRNLDQLSLPLLLHLLRIEVVGVPQPDHCEDGAVDVEDLGDVPAVRDRRGLHEGYMGAGRSEGRFASSHIRQSASLVW